MLDATVRFFQRLLARRRLEYDGLIGVRSWNSERRERRIGFDHSLVLSCLMLVLIWSLCSVLLTLAQRMPVVEGQPMPYSLVAESAFEYEDTAGTEELRQQAAENAPKCFRMDDTAGKRIKTSFQHFFERPEDSAAASEAFAMLSENEDARAVVAEIAKFPLKKEIVQDALSALLKKGVTERSFADEAHPDRKAQITDTKERFAIRALAELESVDKAAEQMSEAILSTVPVDDDRAAMQAVFTRAAARMLRGGNLIHDAAGTEKLAQEARGAVPPKKVSFKAKDTLIERGETVTKEKMALKDQYFEHTRHAGFRSPRMQRFYRCAFWSMVLILLSSFYLYHVHPEVSRSNRRIGVIAMAVSLSLLANYGCYELYQWLVPICQEKGVEGVEGLTPQLVVNVLPLGLVGVLVAPIMGYRVATFTGFFIASTAGLMMDEFSFEYALCGMVTCSLSSLAVRGSTNYRSFFFRTVLSLAPLFWLLNLGINLRVGGISTLLIAGGLSFGNGLVTAVLALLCIFGFELLFNIPTNMSLMVLCDYTHPLLERMKREAPGSFFHSMMVATLAEDAARRIGANALRAKAEGLFHDIGKLSNPQYFTENNQDGVNLHEGLTPQMSSIIIRDHVKEGAILARQYKLGSIVLRAIEQHHGNDLVHYFYRQALEQSKRSGDPVAVEQFRYDGTPPRDKETVIVSLADACEAACRSLTDSSVGRIEGLVGDIFAMRFRDRQLVNSELSLAELEKVRQSFINTLMSMKHGRIAYQKDEEDEDELVVAPADPAAAPAAPPPRTS